jgi:hypothetical protein
MAALVTALAATDRAMTVFGYRLQWLEHAPR